MQLFSGLKRIVTVIAAGIAVAISATAAAGDIPVFHTVEVVNTYPHDTKAFTEGLFISGGKLYESTGLEGHSSWRRVDLETGTVEQRHDLSDALFGEGIIDWNGEIIGLTWKGGLGLIGDLETFKPRREFRYAGEGWGLTRNDQNIFMSDGTDTIRVLDPKTLKTVRTIKVTAEGNPIAWINELEWVEGEIYANLWQSDLIARIDPQSGKVLGWISLSGILRHYDGPVGTVDVANGIAYDAATKRLFVTGKFWPALFEIRLNPPH